MKKILAFGFSLLVLLYSIGVFSIYVERTSITLKPGLNVVSTPGLLKGISFSNSGDNISFATLENNKWKSININNDNVGSIFRPLDGFIVRNGNTKDVTMNLIYDKEIDGDENLLLSKEVNIGRNLLGITNDDNPFNNIKNTTPTSIIDLTNGDESNIISGETFKSISAFKLGKAYGVFINKSGKYRGRNNYANLNKLSQSECKEICEDNNYNCPNECRSGILTGNSINNTPLNINSDTPQTIYDGRFEAKKLININSIYIYGDNTIPEGNSITFYVYIDEEPILDFTLTNENGNNIQYYRPNGKTTIVNTGNNIPVQIKTISTGSNKDIEYNFEFKLLGNNIEFYEINSEKISIAITGEDDTDNKEYHRVTNSYDFSMNDFNAVEDIYTGVRTTDGDRVIFVVRHSARENNCTENGGLTEYGMELASGVGEKLKGEPFADTSTDFYGSSYTKRTVQTSYYVGKNRGNVDLNNNILSNGNEWRDYNYVNHNNSEGGIVEIVYGNYFSDGNQYSSIEHLYEENKDITSERALHAINRLCEITEGHPFSWITSHDWYTLPITERATDEDVSFSTSSSEWPNFMQGIAIIIHEDGGREVYPIRSLEKGKIKTRENPSC